MNDTLSWFEKPYEHRGSSMDLLTNTFNWANDERFICSLSHDEVVHGKKSLLEKMPGDDWQKHANLRLLYAHMWSYPGHKLLFMGGESAQKSEWNENAQLDWEASATDLSQGVRHLVADLNQLYSSQSSLHRSQYDAAGFEVAFRDQDNAAFGMIRKENKMLVFI